MEIGKRSINDAEFANHWAILYQEFYNLASTNVCDASLVYNTIYIVCTSGSSFEEKLYWKIGDFLYNRCKIHKDKILESSDYIAEYSKQFDDYQRLVETIHSLGSFLNDCIKGRKLNEFGYLLWERMVIQNIEESFFNDVFLYAGEAMKILKSFEVIVPDQTQKMLYYKERYEKAALSKISSEYGSLQFRNLIEFCEIIKSILLQEKKLMANYFLDCSHENLRNVIEECLFSRRYYEILVNLIRIFYHINNEIVAVPLGKEQVENSDFAVTFESGEQILELCFERPFTCSSNKSGEFVVNVQKHNEIDLREVTNQYLTLDRKRYDTVKTFVENEFKSNKILLQIHPWIAKRRDNTADISKYGQRNSFNHLIMDSIGLLDTGFVLIKKAYALYIDLIANSNRKILESSVKDVICLIESLDMFENTNCQAILYLILKQHLQRTKPCFMKRLCDFSECITVCGARGDAIENLRPFENKEEFRIFQVAMEIISDRNEFLSMYQNVLRERLIDGRSNLEKEYMILRAMNVGCEDKLYRMVEEIRESMPRLRILSSLNWNIEPEHSALRLPNALLKEMVENIDYLAVMNSKGACVKDDSDPLHFKLKHNGTEDRILNIAHQYTKIGLQINGKTIQANVYQYVVIDHLVKGPASFQGIVRRLNAADKLVQNVIDSLIRARIVKLLGELYFLDCRLVESCDISKIEERKEQCLEICVDSYLQTLGARTLKRIKKMDLHSFALEIKSLSQISVSDENISESLNKLVEKGIAEFKGTLIEFVF